jgi:hypothetical protein
MTLLSDIVTTAFRESGIIPVGETPGVDEVAETVPLLANLINSVLQGEFGELLVPYNVGTSGVTYGPNIDNLIDTIIPLNSRLYCNLSAPTTLYFPPTPHDGAIVSIKDVAGTFSTTAPLTLVGNGRQVAGGTSQVQNSSNYDKTWMFQTFGGWTILSTVSAGTDTVPFPTIFDDMWSIMLAMRINPRYGAQLDEQTLAHLKRLQKRFKTQYKHSEQVTSERGITRLTGYRQFNFSNFNNFYKGN